MQPMPIQKWNKNEILKMCSQQWPSVLAVFTRKNELAIVTVKAHHGYSVRT